MPNERNEKLVSCNFERIRYWIGEGATFSHEAKVVLGMYSLVLLLMSVLLNFFFSFWWKKELVNYCIDNLIQFVGIAGFLPIHPSSYIHAWEKRRQAELPEPPLPKKLTWRERKKILMQQAEEKLKAPQLEEGEEESATAQSTS